MKIEQFEDSELSHYSYAVLSEREKRVVLIDPSRDIAPYLLFATENGAKIIGVIETHPHADLVSGHLESYKATGAAIYCSKLLGAAYENNPFDDGDILEFGEIKLKAINTPGHSADSISILMELEGKARAVFTGDTLFIGDCGRPDLRENVGNIRAKREAQAVQMYHSLREKLMVLPDDVWVYPAHGAGTLCGKSLSEANRSTIAAEKMTNWSLQQMTEQEFVKALLEDQPFIPKYFGYDVELNKHGAPNLEKSIDSVNILAASPPANGKLVVVDTRPEKEFKTNHITGSINIQLNGKFATWLGSIITPEQSFYLTAGSQKDLQEAILRSSKIGYEAFVSSGFVFEGGEEKMDLMDLEKFKSDPASYTIVDVRSESETENNPIFADALNIPLPELRERAAEIPRERPIVVHCAGGYRSAIGSSIVKRAVSTLTQVYDLSDAIKDFIKLSV